MDGRRRKTLLLAAVLGAVVTLPFSPAIADHGCNGTVVDLGVTYIDIRGEKPGDQWIYQETNGVAGLQSGGNHALFGYADECHHDNPDTLIY